MMLQGMMATENETMPKKKSRFRRVLSGIGRLSGENPNPMKKKKKSFFGRVTNALSKYNQDEE